MGDTFTLSKNALYATIPEHLVLKDGDVVTLAYNYHPGTKDLIEYRWDAKERCLVALPRGE